VKKKLNILVIGSGGREHALAWKLASSEECGDIYCMPGSDAISRAARVTGSMAGFREIAAFAAGKDIGMVFVGPEAPLAAGITDTLSSEGVRVFGPCREAARLESSKSFAKEVMDAAGIPTPSWESFDSAPEALDYLRKTDPLKIVIKADGLCGGKGVVLPGSRSEALSAVEGLMRKKTRGEAGSRVIIEERLEGDEVSVLAMVNGNDWSFFPVSRDHKPVYDGDRGPNTGGMGAFAPVFPAEGEFLREVEKRILSPLAGELLERGINYTGILYIGLILTPSGPRVLEFNVRLGDPEAQAVLPLMESDLLVSALGIMEGEAPRLKFREGACVDVVLASGGYPGSYETGFPIYIDKEKIPGDLMLFHSGTRFDDGRYFTAGGRVLNVAALGSTLEEAREKAYRGADAVSFRGKHFRRDIGKGRYKSCRKQ